MRCRVCGDDRLGKTEYRAGGIRAPALECARCHAIQLDESVANSETERDSVRQAIAARQMAAHPWDSGTHPTASAADSIPAAAVDVAVSTVDVALAEVRLCLEFLSQMTDGEAAKAVADAQRAARLIAGVMEDLGRWCETATRETGETDGLPSKKGTAR